MEACDMFKRIDHVEIIPSDFERTIEFYTDILGFKIKTRRKIDRDPINEIIFIELGDTVVELISIRNPAPKSAAEWEVGYTSMAIEVEDMDRAIEYLKTKGVKISREPVVIGTSKRAEIKDPDGLTIELRQW